MPGIILGTHHLVATRTILRGRKQHDPRCPEIIHSGNFESCRERMATICGVAGLNDSELVRRGQPLYSTNDWTYYTAQSPEN